MMTSRAILYHCREPKDRCLLCIDVPTLQSRGFTLIELVASLVIIALIAGLAVVSLDGLRERAQAEDVTAMIRQFECLTRVSAERFGRATQLEIDLDRRALTRMHGDSDSTSATPRLQLPRGTVTEGLAFRQVRSQSPGAWITSGQVVLTYSPDGRGGDFAFRLGASNDSEQGTVVIWMVSGLTGQWTGYEQESAFETIWNELGATRDDTG